MLLKNAFPSLHCYSFGTPGSVVDEVTCRGNNINALLYSVHQKWDWHQFRILRIVEIAPYVTSIVLGNDIVSRLNFQSLCGLRKDILDTISRAKVNKMVIMKAMLKDMDPEDLLYAPGQEPATDFKSSVERFHVRYLLSFQLFCNNTNWLLVVIYRRALMRDWRRIMAKSCGCQVEWFISWKLRVVSMEWINKL